MNCPWGEKALSNYLGNNREDWQDYDACELVRKHNSVAQPVLVDQGDTDQFLSEQLKPELLRESFDQARRPIELRMQNGYDHSYFFISTFIGDHFEHHAKALCG